MDKEGNRKLIKIFFAIELIGCFFIMANRLEYFISDFSKCNNETVGIIINTEENKLGDILYYPVYQIQIGEKKYVHKRAFGSEKISWKIGEEVIIKYDISNPNIMYSEEEKKWHDDNAISMLCGTIGILLLVIVSNLVALRKR